MELIDIIMVSPVAARRGACHLHAFNSKMPCHRLQMFTKDIILKKMGRISIHQAFQCNPPRISHLAQLAPFGELEYPPNQQRVYP